MIALMILEKWESAIVNKEPRNFIAYLHCNPG